MAEPVFLITGASSGIGAATARQGAADGYRVALIARTTERVGPLAEELGGDARALGIACDVTEWEQVENAIETTLSAFGRIDVVFANAGFGATRGFLAESPEHWKAMVLTNVLGVAYTVRASVDALAETEGHLLMTGSVAGHVALPGSVYSATKHAVHSMAESARKELLGRGIRTTLISPGNVDTPFFDNTPTVAMRDEDVARAVMFAVHQPPSVGINEILMRHPQQDT
ncbi:MAG: SDR family oxidoreductase [Thermoleophilia bacterium]|nr:SDR family oxidoreductase [Thermoleophilia bacterium]